MEQLKTRMLVACLLVAMASCLAVQHRSNKKLREELGSLRRDARSLGEVMNENRRLSNLLAEARTTQITSNGWFHELLRLRGEVTSLRSQQEQGSFVYQQSPSHPQLKQEHFSQPPPARDSFAFAGYGSPESAFQTALWAMSNGDTNAILASLAPEERTKKEKEWTGLPEAEIQKQATNEIQGINGYRILGSETISDDEVELNVDLDTELTKMKMRIKRINGEWKFVGKAAEHAEQ
jgi:hypothetical protein